MSRLSVLKQTWVRWLGAGAMALMSFGAFGVQQAEAQGPVKILIQEGTMNSNGTAPIHFIEGYKTLINHLVSTPSITLQIDVRDGSTTSPYLQSNVQADVDVMNTYDLVIIGRMYGNNADPTSVTAPLLCMISYRPRQDRWAWYADGSGNMTGGIPIGTEVVNNYNSKLLRGINTTTLANGQTLDIYKTGVSHSSRIFAGKGLNTNADIALTSNDGNNYVMLAYFQKDVPYFTGTTRAPMGPRAMWSILDDLDGSLSSLVDLNDNGMAIFRNLLYTLQPKLGDINSVPVEMSHFSAE